MMSFKQAIVTCIRQKYFRFSGRAQRSEYWWFYLFFILVIITLSILGGVLFAVTTPDSGEISLLSIIAVAPLVLLALALVLPYLSVSARRFHDVGFSGWWFAGLTIASLIPVLGGLFGLAAFVFTLLPGTTGRNKFGDDPLDKTNASVFE